MSRAPTVFVSLNFHTVHKDTEKAYLIAVRREEDKPLDMIWIPKSQVQSVVIEDYGTVTMMIAEWILIEKNLLSLAHSQKEGMNTANISDDFWASVPGDFLPKENSDGN